MSCCSIRWCGKNSKTSNYKTDGIIFHRPSPPRMPLGLMELMDGLTREVLKHNPSEVYGFCASHMHQLLDKRDGPSPKKSLPLEEKIAKAQGKVRKRAEARRQEYDKKILLVQQNSNTTINDIKDDIIAQFTQLPAIVPNGVSTDLNKVILSVEDEITQNNIKSPVQREQMLKNSAELVISQSALEVSNTGDYLAECKSIEDRVMQTNDNVNEEKFENVSESNHEPNINIILKEIASDMTPHSESLNKNVIDNIDSDIFKSPPAVIQVNESLPDEKLLNNNVQVEIIDRLKDNEKAEHNIIDAEHGVEHNIIDAEHGLERAAVYDSNRQVSLKKSNDIESTIEDATKSSKVESIYEAENLNETLNNQNDAVNSQTASYVVETDNNEVIQNITSISLVQADNTDTNHFLKENSSDISEKNIQQKCDDGDLFNSVDNSDDVHNKQEHIESNNLEQHDIKEIKTPVLEPEVYIGPLANGVDNDIPTLVTQNTLNDTQEINISANERLQTITSSENMSEVPEQTKDMLISDKNVRDLMKDADDSTKNVKSSTNSNEANNDETTQGKVSTIASEKNTETQETNHMDLETAAITIQKVFRNFLFKSRGSTFDTTNDDGNFLEEEVKTKEECDFSITNALNVDRRAHGITRMDTVLQTVNEEKSLSLSTDDSSTLSSAATIIQAHVRGFLVRNKLNSNKTLSNNSLAVNNLNEPSITSIEANKGSDQNKNKTVLNIHIVPEGDNCFSRDESLITSVDLSLDSSPPSSINLHPLGYDKSERRKQLKREDAIQSISPPSNNSGKLSEDFDSVKELSLNEHDHDLSSNNTASENLKRDNVNASYVENSSLEIHSKRREIVDNKNNTDVNNADDPQTLLKMKRESLNKQSSDEMDVVTPDMTNEDLASSILMHSGEFHDAVLPTRVSRSDTSVVSGE